MNILFISNNNKKCGVGEYGRSIFSAMQKYSKHIFSACFVDPNEKFDGFSDKIDWADIIFVNYMPVTLPHCSSFLSRLDNKPLVGLIHTYHREEIKLYSAYSEIFKYRIHTDPTLLSQVPNVFSAPRVIPEFISWGGGGASETKNEIFTIGTVALSMGSSKGYEKIISYVEENFDEAHIRIHMPFGDFTEKKNDKNLEVIKRKIKKPGVILSFSHEYLEVKDLINFLSQNDLNVSFYDEDTGEKDGGISSTTDMLIAAEKPIVLTNCYMYRHIRYYAPELFIDNSSLDQILEIGTEKVKFLKDLWSEKNAAKYFDEIFEKILDDEKKLHYLKLNTILTDDMRIHYNAQIMATKKLCPVEFFRKIPRANVQQAFIKDVFEKYAKNCQRFLCVGSYEDTAYLSLQKEGFIIEGIDPVLNRNLDEHFKFWNNTLPYDIIFSVSVIEHVKNDSEFVFKIANMLAPGGYAIFTMDFLSDWKESDPLVSCDCRFYTTKYILERIIPFMPYCEMVDFYDWDKYQPDFDFKKFRYSFATLVLRKRNISLLDEINFERYRPLIEQYIRCPPSINFEQEKHSLKDNLKKIFPFLPKLKRKFFAQN
jgi:SAM-dependent methyltransferase